jgi:CheY-like chemotaxis protein
MKPLNLILLIDDDETTNFINHRTLVKSNIALKIDIYPDAEDALAYLQQAAAAPNQQTVPELIFLDIKMPKMDGFEFLEAYRQLNIPLVLAPQIMMLTSSASFYDLKRMEQFEEVKKHFSKPLSVADVRDLITEFFPQNKLSE